jgi:hypothetical protein
MTTGKLFKVELPKAKVSIRNSKVTLMAEFHSGAVTGLLTLPVAHMAVTAGADGTVRIYDYQYALFAFVPTTANPCVCRATMETPQSGVTHGCPVR